MRKLILTLAMLVLGTVVVNGADFSASTYNPEDVSVSVTHFDAATADVVTYKVPNIATEYSVDNNDLGVHSYLYSTATPLKHQKKNGKYIYPSYVEVLYYDVNPPDLLVNYYLHSGIYMSSNKLAKCTIAFLNPLCLGRSSGGMPYISGLTS